MPGYVIADVDVQDAEAYEDYKQLVPATLEPYGGRFVVRGGEVERLEGTWEPHRIVLLEFPSPEHARRWYESEQYAAAKALRQRASVGSLLLVRGVEP
ncbi:MAG TPA: DUF1330 domain-containing protein [Gaiellaceae bacterium]|nr:DUF1330 domain-containing protein [Gaiellaceae bacterium]